jgi:hypothetical protein
MLKAVEGSNCDCARATGWCHVFDSAEAAKQAYPGAKLVLLLDYEERKVESLPLGPPESR